MQDVFLKGALWHLSSSRHFQITQGVRREEVTGKEGQRKTEVRKGFCVFTESAHRCVMLTSSAAGIRELAHWPILACPLSPPLSPNLYHLFLSVSHSHPHQA